MSGYYVLAQEPTGLTRTEAATLPEAQRVMYRKAPSAAIFVGKKCFAKSVGISVAVFNELQRAANAGSLGSCSFCSNPAVVVDSEGDAFCSDHESLRHDRESEDEGKQEDADAGEEEEASAAGEDEDAGSEGVDEDVELDPPAPLVVKVTKKASALPPKAAPQPLGPAAAKAEATCVYPGCSAPRSEHPTDDETLAPYCGRHRGIAKSHGNRPGQPDTATATCERCKVNPRGPSTHRTREAFRLLCMKCRKAQIDETYNAKRKTAAARPSPKKLVRRSEVPTQEVNVPAQRSPESRIREHFERLLKDHELVETIGRDVVEAIARRVKGGAR